MKWNLLLGENKMRRDGGRRRRSRNSTEKKNYKITVENIQMRETRIFKEPKIEIETQKKSGNFEFVWLRFIKTQKISLISSCSWRNRQRENCHHQTASKARIWFRRISSPRRRTMWIRTKVTKRLINDTLFFLLHSLAEIGNKMKEKATEKSTQEITKHRTGQK